MSTQSQIWLRGAPGTMGLAVALLGILVVIFIALGFLLVAGIIYFEFSNSDVPAGIANPGKLRIIHCIMVGIAVVVSTLCICNIGNLYMPGNYKSQLTQQTST